MLFIQLTVGYAHEDSANNLLEHFKGHGNDEWNSSLWSGEGYLLF